MVTKLIQAPNPNKLKEEVDALIAAGKTISNIFVLADKSWYLVLHSA